MLEEYLKLTMDDGFDNETFLVLKDIHGELNNPKVIALLKRIAENNLYNDDYSTTIFVISEITVIPRELENYITVFDIPLPTSDEILTLIHEFIEDLQITVEQDVINDITLSFKGLNEFQIKQILNLAYQDGGCIDQEDKLLILKEKEQFIKKSGMLEIVNFSETIDDIGGLENLKEWLQDVLNRDSKISEFAREAFEKAANYLEDFVNNRFIHYTSDILSYIASGVWSVFGIVYDIVI